MFTIYYDISTPKKIINELSIPRKKVEQGLNKNKIKTVCFPLTQREDRESE